MNETEHSNDAWLNDEFLASVLRRDEHDDTSLVVVSSSVENAVSTGDNYGSVLVRVTVEYTIDDGALTKCRTIIVKTPPLGEIMLLFMKEVHIFERELRMYAVTLPAMYELVKEKTGEQLQFGPKHLHVDRPDTVVLEDLRPLGYKMANRRQGLDFEHSVVALTTLAKFHATSLALHEKDPASIEFYEEVMYVKELREKHAVFVEPTFTSLGTEVESWPGYERFGDKVRKFALEAVDKIIEIMNRDSPLKVLIHGDFWTNNMLFRYDEKGEIVDLKMLDFQLIRHSSMAVDITYLLYTSPKQSVLEEFEDELMEIYLKEFNNTLKRLDCEHLFLTMDQLDREMKEIAYFSVFVSMISCIMVAEPDDAPKLDALTEENKDTLGTTVMNKAFAGKSFRSVFERRLAKFEAQGLI